MVSIPNFGVGKLLVSQEDFWSHLSTANEANVTYVLEWLEVCITSLNAINLNFQQLRIGTLTVYCVHVEQILSICP